MGQNEVEIVGDITDVETIASGRGIRRLKHLRKRFGGRRWRKNERRGDGSGSEGFDATSRSTLVRGTRGWQEGHEDQTISGLKEKMKRVKASPRFALCVRAGSVDLERRKVYQVLPDRAATRDGYVRVVDESGEDYLYPAEYFVPVRLPAAVLRDLEKTSLIDVPANTALQPTVGAHHRSRRTRLRAARG